MPRTKSDGMVKAGGKAPRKVGVISSGSKISKKKSKSTFNPVVIRATPVWQIPISKFFINEKNKINDPLQKDSAGPPKNPKDDAVAGTSSGSVEEMDISEEYNSSSGEYSQLESTSASNQFDVKNEEVRNV